MKLLTKISVPFLLGCAVTSSVFASTSDSIPQTINTMMSTIYQKCSTANDFTLSGSSGGPSSCLQDTLETQFSTISAAFSHGSDKPLCLVQGTCSSPGINQDMVFASQRLSATLHALEYQLYQDQRVFLSQSTGWTDEEKLMPMLMLFQAHLQLLGVEIMASTQFDWNDPESYKSPTSFFNMALYHYAFLKNGQAANPSFALLKSNILMHDFPSDVPFFTALNQVYQSYLTKYNIQSNELSGSILPNLDKLIGTFGNEIYDNPNATSYLYQKTQQLINSTISTLFNDILLNKNLPGNLTGTNISSFLTNQKAMLANLSNARLVPLFFQSREDLKQTFLDFETMDSGLDTSELVTLSTATFFKTSDVFVYSVLQGNAYTQTSQLVDILSLLDATFESYQP